MSRTGRVCVWIFSQLLYLFPRKFQQEFGDELRGNFTASLEEAPQISRWEFLAVCLRELRDLPINLLRTHFDRRRMNTIFHSPTFHFGWKGALAFGISFGAAKITWAVVNNVVSAYQFNHLACVVQMDGCQLAANVTSNLVSSIVGSLVGGCLFAVIFTGIKRFWRFARWGILAFLVPDVIYWALVFTKLGSSQWPTYFGEILTGLCLGLIVATLAGSQAWKIVITAAGSILYPVLVEFFSRVTWKLFPPASSQFFSGAEVYRNFCLEFVLAGIIFGLVLGVIFGWQKRKRKTLEN